MRNVRTSVTVILAVLLSMMGVAGLSSAAPASSSGTVTRLEYLRVAKPGETIVAAPVLEGSYGRWPSTTIKVQDATDGGWRVAESAAEWNRAKVINLVVSRDACANCIRVTESSSLPMGYGGLAHITSRDGILLDVWVELASQYQYPHPVADTIESHEIGGHGSGLPHLLGYAVMNAVATYSSPGAPTARDRRALRDNYRR